MKVTYEHTIPAPVEAVFELTGETRVEVRKTLEVRDPKISRPIPGESARYARRNNSLGLY